MKIAFIVLTIFITFLLITNIDSINKDDSKGKLLYSKALESKGLNEKLYLQTLDESCQLNFLDSCKLLADYYQKQFDGEESYKKYMRKICDLDEIYSCESSELSKEYIKAYNQNKSQKNKESQID